MVVHAFAWSGVPFMKNSTVIAFMSRSSRMFRSKSSLCVAVSADVSPEPNAPEKYIDDVLDSRKTVPFPSTTLPLRAPGTSWEYTILTVLAVDDPSGTAASLGSMLRSPSNAIHSRVAAVSSASRAAASNAVPVIRNS